MAGKVWRLPPIIQPVKFDPPKPDYQSTGEEAGVSFTVVGGGTLADNLMKLPKAAMDAAGYEMSAIAQEIIHYAQDNNLIPFDTGALHDSGDWDDYDPSKFNQNVTQIACWFGGDVTAEQAAHGITKEPQRYALEQHENLEYHHTIGGPKYLENPFNLFQPTVLPRIAAKVAEVLNLSASLTKWALTKEPA